MKALWITSSGGTLNGIRPEAETLIGLARNGVECEIMTRGTSVYGDAYREAGIRLIDYEPRRKLGLADVKRIRRTLVEGGHDILHLFNNKAIANGALAARGLPVKVISYRGQTGNVHRYDPSCWLTHLNPRIDRVICVAESVRRDLAPRRLDPASCVTVYKGHDTAWYDDEPADLEARFGIPKGSFVVASVANYRPRKGLDVLVRALDFLPAEADIRLLLVGAGMDRPPLARAIERSPFRQRIHLAGFQENPCALVAACDASVLASTKREGLPKTVIESMAYRVPPIVTDTGGSAELVVDGECGLVVPPGDAPAIAAALLRLYGDRELARRMGERARVRIQEHFNVRQTIEQTLAVYRAVLDT